jgi:hypothetical protein
MVSGVYCDKGTIVKVNPSGKHPVFPDTVVEVQTSDQLIHFDKRGEACDGKGTFECGLWKLTDTH